MLMAKDDTGPGSSVGRVSASWNARSQVRSCVVLPWSSILGRGIPKLLKMELAAPRLALRLTGTARTGSLCVVYLHTLCLYYTRNKCINPSHAVRDLSRVRQYPPWLLFTTFVDSVGYSRYNLQKTRKQ